MKTVKKALIIEQSKCKILSVPLIEASEKIFQISEQMEKV